jgi:hypothetical protein
MHLSGWARPFVDSDFQQSEQSPRNVTPMSQQPLALWHRQQIADALERRRRARRECWTAASGMVLLFVVSDLPLWHWVTMVAWWLCLVQGCRLVLNIERAWIAGIESRQPLDL